MERFGKHKTKEASSPSIEASMEPSMALEFAHNGVFIERMPSAPKRRAFDVSDITAADRAKTPLIQKQAANLAEVCERFLSGSIVTDAFNTHEERRHWRHEMDGKYGGEFHDILEKNMLKLNNLAGIYSYMEFVVSGLDGMHVETKTADAIRAIAKKMPDLSRYEQCSADERVAIAKQIEGICEAYVAVLAVPERKRR